MNVAQIIIQKLDALQSQVTRLQAQLDSNFLLQEYPETAPVTPAASGRKKRTTTTNYSSKLPPSISAELLSDEALTQGTRISYGAHMQNIMSEPEYFAMLVNERNSGTLHKDIAELFKAAGSVFKTKSATSNSITVAKRYGLIENQSGLYVLTQKFKELTGVE